MVCVACLLPLFLVPIVSFLPILFDYIMMKVYALFGWEYRKPERAPPACPIKPRAAKSDVKVRIDKDIRSKKSYPFQLTSSTVGTTEGGPNLTESVLKQQVGEEHNKSE